MAWLLSQTARAPGVAASSFVDDIAQLGERIDAVGGSLDFDQARFGTIESSLARNAAATLGLSESVTEISSTVEGALAELEALKQEMGFIRGSIDALQGSLTGLDDDYRSKIEMLAERLKRRTGTEITFCDSNCVDL